MSRVGQWARLLAKDNQQANRWVDLYIHHRNLYNKGEGEIGFARRLVGIQPLMLTWLFVKNLFPALPNWVVVVAIPVVIVTKIVANWTMGYVWEKKNFFEREQTWSNERNKLAKNLSQKLLDNGGI